ncbi:MAG: Ig-like domain-containing protein [Gemmatimonadaceae bacterium]|nr:Ig-like domain-containing protein [Gemmatimonadaceae bacterium]
MRIQCIVVACAGIGMLGCKDSGAPSGPTPGVTASVEVTPGAVTLTARGSTQQLAATVRDGRGATIGGKTVSWQSSAPTTANVDERGLVTALAAGAATITASVDGKSGQATVSVAPVVSQLVITTTPANTTAGASFTVSVEARDAGGAAVSTFTGSVSLALATNAGNAVLAGPTVVNAVAGVATLTGISVARAGTGYRLIATSAANAITSSPSSAFDVAAGAFAKLAFVVQPPSAVEGNLRMAPTVKVETRDAFDNVMNGPAVTMSLTSMPWQRTRLLGTLTQPVSSGAASFNDLAVDRPGTGYRLEASAGGATIASNAFAVRLSFTDVTVGGTNSQGSGFSCGIAAGGTWCWGVNNSGQLGSPRAALVETVPFLVESPVPFTQVNAGNEFVCGLTSAGEVWCWGKGTEGQLGDGLMLNSATPVKVFGTGGGRVYTFIDVGEKHACGLVGAAAYCWGANTLGQIGTGATSASQPTPWRISGTGVAPLDFVQISAGMTHTCAVTAANAVRCWGGASGGALGDGQEVTNRTLPVLVTGSGVAPLRFAKVAAGMGRTCAVTTGLGTERVYCWGSNSGGYLGIGAGTPQGTVLFPTVVSAPSPVDFRAITGSSNATCALDAAGGTWCWGRGVDGEMGNGVLSNQPAAVAVTVPAGGFARVAMGGVHGCGLSATGSGIYCWGGATGGSLGDGTSQGRSVPTRIVQ